MASLSKKKDQLGDYWQLRWRDEDGKSRERTLRVDEYTEAQAHEALADVQAVERVRNRTNKAPGLSPSGKPSPATTPTLQEVIDETWRPLALVSLAGSTISTYDSMINSRVPAALKARPIGQITAYDLRLLLAETVQSHAVATARKLRNVLSSIWQAAVNREIVGVNIARGIPIQAPAGKTDLIAVPRNKVIPPHVVWQIAKAINPRYRELVLVLGFAGLRIGEAVALDVADVDAEELTISVTKTLSRSTTKYSKTKGHCEIKPPKTAASNRKVKLPTELMAEIVPLLDREPHERLFAPARGEYISPPSFRTRYWNPVAAAFGHSERTVHDLRHTAASFMIEQGLPPTLVAAQLGHANSQVTMSTYAGWWDEERDDAVALTGKGITAARDQAEKAQEVAEAAGAIEKES